MHVLSRVQNYSPESLRPRTSYAPCARITHRRTARALAKAAGVLPSVVRRPAPALLPHVPPPPRPCATPRRCSVLPMTVADDCRS